MSTKSEAIKPKNDLQLALNYSNHCVWKILKNDLCAGANAASRVDMALSAAEPLSEIVWSPDRGFSLRCVDSSFADKNASHNQDVGPSSVVLAVLQSVNGGGSPNTDMPVDDVFVNPVTAVCVKSGVSSADALSRHPSDQSDVIIPDCKGRVDNFLLQADEPKASMEPTSPTKISGGEMDIGSGCQGVVIEDGLFNKVEHIIEYDDSGAQISSSRNLFLEKLESTAENDLQSFNCEATCGEALVPMSNADDRYKAEGNGKMQPNNNSRIHKAITENKEKPLSSVRLSKEENDNHLSVESCYNAGLFLKCKKRCSYRPELMIGSKRIRKQIQEGCYSKSEVKRDSSFMNLVSNMMKGFLHPIQDDAKSLSLVEANHDQHPLWQDQKPKNCKENQDSEPKSACFRSYLNSRSYPCSENFGMTNSRRVGEASKGIAVTPITCYAENNPLYQQYLQSHKFEASVGIYDANTSLKPKIKPIHFLNNAVENINCSALPNYRKHLSYLNGSKMEGTKEHPADDEFLREAARLQLCCLNEEASTGLKDSMEKNNHASKQRFVPITPFPGLRDSEPMASMFARRLGAIKHMPTNRTDSIPNRKASSSSSGGGAPPPQKLVLTFQLKKI